MHTRTQTYLHLRERETCILGENNNQQGDDSLHESKAQNQYEVVLKCQMWSCESPQSR